MEWASKKVYVLLIYVALALATFIAYGQLCHSDFVNYDDDVYVTENRNVNRGITAESVFLKNGRKAWFFMPRLSSNTCFCTDLDENKMCQSFSLFGVQKVWQFSQVSVAKKHPDFQVTSCHHFDTTNVDFACIESEIMSFFAKIQIFFRIFCVISD